MIKKGYKVVSDDLKSFTTIKGGIQYKVGEKVFPKKDCGPLCVFDTLEYTAFFNKKPFRLGRIFKCEFELSNYNVVWIKAKYTFLIDLLVGTVLADWVKLTEEVKFND